MRTIKTKIVLTSEHPYKLKIEYAEGSKGGTLARDEKAQNLLERCDDSGFDPQTRERVTTVRYSDGADLEKRDSIERRGAGSPWVTTSVSGRRGESVEIPFATYVAMGRPKVIERILSYRALE